MAFQHDGKDYTYLAGADLSTKQFHAVELNSADAVTVFDGTGKVVGFLQNKPKAGEAATVRVAGATKAIASAAITQGALVSAGNDGRVATTAGTGIAIGQAELGAGAANDVVTVNLTLPGVTLSGAEA
jgi:hypothetical protein